MRFEKQVTIHAPRTVVWDSCITLAPLSAEAAAFLHKYYAWGRGQ